MATQYFNDAQHGPHRAISDFGFASPGTFYGLGVTDIFQNTASYTLDKSTGSWVSTEWPYKAGEITWHGGGETISFHGPKSRTFTDTVTETSARGTFKTNIYRDGVSPAWALTPLTFMFVFGAGITNIGGSKYLTIAVLPASDSPLRIYQRDYATSYPNNDFYDAETNPLGWKTLLFYTLPHKFVRQPFFFNASGTEAQSIVGPDYGRERVIITVGAGTASASAVAVPVAVTNQSDSASRSSSDSISVTIGTAEGDPICGDIGCTYLKLDVTTNMTETTSGQDSIQTPEGLIVAVDYIGDTESFLTAEQWASHSSSSSLSGVRRDFMDQGVNEQPRTASSTYSKSGGGSQGTKLKIGNLEWQYTGNTNSYYITEDMNYSHGSSASRSANETSTITFYDRSLHYCDIRHKLLIYSERVSTTNNTLDTVLARAGAGETSDQTWISDTTDVFKHVVNMNGDETVIWSTTEASDSNTFSWVNYQYAEYTGTNNSSSNNTTASVDEPFPLALHSSIKSKQGTVQAEVDGAGNLFASTTIWHEDNAGAFTESGYWNSLTGGDPVALTGLAGANPRFTVISLFKY